MLTELQVIENWERTLSDDDYRAYLESPLNASEIMALIRVGGGEWTIEAFQNYCQGLPMFKESEHGWDVEDRLLEDRHSRGYRRVLDPDEPRD